MTSPETQKGPELPKADEIYRYFLFGQRCVLNMEDAQMPRDLSRTIEEFIAECVANHEDVEVSTMHRYLAGELTGGVPPLERLPRWEEMFTSLEWFFTVLEWLRLRVDEPRNKPASQIKKTSKQTRLLAGALGPFVATHVDNDIRVLCWCCKNEQSYDLVMRLPKPKCQNCGATSKDGS